MEEIKRKLSVLSILSFICGIFGVVLLGVLHLLLVRFGGSGEAGWAGLGFIILMLPPSIISSLLAIILGIIALGKIKKKSAILKGKGLAIAGIILGGPWIFWVILAIIYGNLR